MSANGDPVFRAIERLRAPGTIDSALGCAWRAWRGDEPRSIEVRPRSTNYKPFDRARMMVEATIQQVDGERVALDLFLECFATAGRARREAERGWARGYLECGGPPVFVLEPWETVVWVLPNAPNLPELAWLLEPEGFRRLLGNGGGSPPSRPRLVRYVPWKRALLEWRDDGGARHYAKLYDAIDHARAAANLGAVGAAADRAELAFAVPRLVRHNPLCRTILMTEVPGVQFTEVMRSFDPDTFAPVGRALASLHASAVVPEARWTAKSELDTLRKHAAGFALVLPDLGPPVAALVDRIHDRAEETAGEESRAVHGNLFGDQILFANGAIGIVDWDALASGDPLYDLGRLAAHAVYLGGVSRVPPAAVAASIDRLLAAYQAEAARSIDARSFRWHVATSLVLRGKTSSLRPLPPGWRDHLRFVVAEADRILSGRSEYLPDGRIELAIAPEGAP